MKDEEIITLYFARDERAIRETEQAYGKLCLALAERILGSREDGEECVNDTWLRTWNSIPPQRPQSLAAYVTRITRNLSLDRLKARGRKKRAGGFSAALDELEDCLPDGGTLPDSLPYLLDEFLDGLDDTERRLFMGRYWYGYTPDRLAAAYGMTANAVNLRIKRTRDKLRALLTERRYRI